MKKGLSAERRAEIEQICKWVNTGVASEEEIVDAFADVLDELDRQAKLIVLFQESLGRIARQTADAIAGLASALEAQTEWLQAEADHLQLESGIILMPEDDWDDEELPE